MYFKMLKYNQCTHSFLKLNSSIFDLEQYAKNMEQWFVYISYCASSVFRSPTRHYIGFFSLLPENMALL